MKNMTAGRRAAIATALLISMGLGILPGCKKDPPPTNGSTAAKGSLLTDGGECMTPGIHVLGIPGRVLIPDSDYVDLHINVTKAGSYQFSTDQVSGVRFSASGNFTDTGLQSVRLKGSGTFAAGQAADYPISFDSSHCAFSIPLVDTSSANIPEFEFRINVGGHVYTGRAYMDYHPSVPFDPAKGNITAIGPIYVGGVFPGLSNDTSVRFAFPVVVRPVIGGYDSIPTHGEFEMSSILTGIFYDTKDRFVTVTFSSPKPQVATITGYVYDTSGRLLPFYGLLKDYTY